MARLVRASALLTQGGELNGASMTGSGRPCESRHRCVAYSCQQSRRSREQRMAVCWPLDRLISRTRENPEPKSAHISQVPGATEPGAWTAEPWRSSTGAPLAETCARLVDGAGAAGGSGAVGVGAGAGSAGAGTGLGAGFGAGFGPGAASCGAGASGLGSGSGSGDGSAVSSDGAGSGAASGAGASVPAGWAGADCGSCSPRSSAAPTTEAPSVNTNTSTASSPTTRAMREPEDGGASAVADGAGG